MCVTVNSEELATLPEVAIVGSSIMSKRKAGEGLPFGTKAGKAVRFDDNVQESEDGFIGPGPLPAERGAEGEKQEDRPEKQHTLDSDEEDNEESSTKYDVMTEDDVEGQEEETVDYDDGEKITPFNMKEEMEEGHFDKQGNYFFKKDAEIKDAWLDNVDWKKIKQNENAAKDKANAEDGGKDDNDGDDEDDDGNDDDNLEDYSPSVIGWKEKAPLYEEIISLMLPGENVFKAIKRLGGDRKGKTWASNRWKKKKSSSISEPTDDDKTEDANKEAESESAKSKEAMLRLTALADQLLQSGDLGVYESTVEKLKHELERNRPGAASTTTTKSADADDDDDDDALDMFADEIDATKLNKTNAASTNNGVTSETSKTETAAASSEAGVAQDFSHEVHWWYRWEKSHSAEEHGPFPSTQMKTWTDLGYFPNGVWLRKDEQQVRDDLGNLYNSERIDFELYT